MVIMRRSLATNHPLVIFVFTLSFIVPNWAQELDKSFYNITFNETALRLHNQQKNIECDVEIKELYRYTAHNFNEPVVEQTIAEAGKSNQFAFRPLEYRALTTLSTQQDSIRRLCL